MSIRLMNLLLSIDLVLTTLTLPNMAQSTNSTSTTGDDQPSDPPLGEESLTSKLVFLGVLLIGVCLGAALWIKRCQEQQEEFEEKTPLLNTP